MVKTPSDQNRGELEQRTKALFDDSVERLDARTRSKLTQARNAALDELKKGSVRWRWMRAPAGLAAAAVVAVAVVMWPGGGQAPAGLALEDFDIVADAENLEMLEDVEFYAWLEDQTAADAGDQRG